MIKLITTDIDGTLIEEGHNRLNPRYHEIILKLKEKGIVFAAASGRQYNSIVSIFEPIKDDMIFIAENGAYVTCRGQLMSVSEMNRALIHELIQDMRQIEGSEIFYSGETGGFLESKDQDYIDLMVNGYKNKITIVDDLLEVEEDCIKISLYHRNNPELTAGPVLIPKWQDRFQVVCAGKEWLDFMNLNVNKGEAIKTIQTMLRISKEETMSFGDNLNDIEMLKQAKYSYAIGNARDEVKEAANYIADTNTNDGVLKVLEALLSKGTQV